MRRASIGMMILLAAMLAASPAQAYFCWGKTDMLDVLRDADVVFSGTVTKLEDMGADPQELRTNRMNVVFKVHEAWKGLPYEGSRTVSADTEAFYEYDFKVGETYLVIGYRMYGDRISMVGCPRVQQIDSAAKIVRDLGEPTVVFTDAKMEEKKGSVASEAAAKPIQTEAPAPEDALQEPPQLDDGSINTLLDALQEGVPAAADGEASPQAPAIEAAPENPVEPLLSQPAQLEKTSAPVVAPQSTVVEPITPEGEPVEQLDVIWEKGKLPAQVAPVVPAPDAQQEPVEQLDVIWEKGKGQAPAPDMPAPDMPAPPPPMPGGER